MVAVNAAATIFVAVAFLGVGLRTPLHNATEALGVSAVFSTCIGTLCAVLIPRVTPLFWHVGFPFNWILLSLLIYGTAIAGSVLAIGSLFAAGFIVSAEQFWDWFGTSSRYAIVTTLTFGIAVSAYEMMRRRLDETTLELRTKERDEAEARRVTAEAQLASLESRVQPHFLFNTLNSIASLIHEDPKGAERMTGQLASLLRSSLDAGELPLVPLEQELTTVREYLDIEQVRFGGRLRTAFDVDEASQRVMVPRLSLQTLVENAVKYAVSPRREGGLIVVRARSVGSAVRLEVEDDGPGFDPAGVRNRHGLDLLRARLALNYGDRARLEIQSLTGRTTAAIEVPGPG
jgi:sensor histidine kinase YesM